MCTSKPWRENGGHGEQEQWALNGRMGKNEEYSIEWAQASGKQNWVCRFYGQTNIPWHS